MINLIRTLTIHNVLEGFLTYWQTLKKVNVNKQQQLHFPTVNNFYIYEKKKHGHYKDTKFSQ